MGALDSLYKVKAGQWGPYYEAIKDILGDTGTILCFGDVRRGGQPNAATFTTTRRTASGLEAVFTWSEAPSAFDTAFDLTLPANWQGLAPVLTLNGTDEQVDSPDATYWTSGNGTPDGATSWGFWARKDNNTGAQAMLVKYGTAGATSEWQVTFQSGALRLLCRDNSATVNMFRLEDTASSLEVWHFYLVVYDGSGGASAANGITIYVDGAVSASTATNDAAYVAMENQTEVVTLGEFSSAGGSFFGGRIIGGPWGPFYTQIALTAAQVKRLFEVVAEALGL